MCGFVVGVGGGRQGAGDSVVELVGHLFDADGDDDAHREPLATLAVVAQTEPLTLTPLAGAIPTGGMSGGPVFDARGALIGLFASVNRIESAAAARYTYSASPLPPADRWAPDATRPSHLATAER